MDNRKLKRGGFYFYENQPYVSVTNVLKVLDKPALRYWFGKEVYWAMVNNPDLDEKSALNAPYKTSGKAKNRGSTVHGLVETFQKTGKVETADPEYQGYAEAFNKWVHEYNARIREHEKTVINKLGRYAGTLDILGEVAGKNVILDIKTGKDIYPEAGLQLSAYKHCDNVEAEAIGVVLLQPTGNYKFEWMDDDFDIFLACKKIWEWQNRELLQKLSM